MGFLIAFGEIINRFIGCILVGLSCMGYSNLVAFLAIRARNISVW